MPSQPDEPWWSEDDVTSLGPVDPEELRGRPIGDLVGQLTRQYGTLLRQEAALAKTELQEKARSVEASGLQFGGALALCVCAAGALTASAILTLALIIPGWAAALVVALVETAVAAVLAARGRGGLREAMPPLPTQTMQTVGEDLEWARKLIRSDET